MTVLQKHTTSLSTEGTYNLKFTEYSYVYYAKCQEDLEHFSEDVSSASHSDHIQVDRMD